MFGDKCNGTYTHTLTCIYNNMQPNDNDKAYRSGEENISLNI